MDLALNNLQRLICHKTQTTNQHHNLFQHSPFTIVNWKTSLQQYQAEFYYNNSFCYFGNSRYPFITFVDVILLNVIAHQATYIQWALEMINPTDKVDIVHP